MILGTSFAAIFNASPSAIAVLPTPGSPTNIGLFFLRLQRIWITLFISFSLPITGSILFSFAFTIRSIEYFERFDSFVSVFVP